MNLGTNVKVSQSSTNAAVGTTAVNGSVIDMSGFEGVLLTMAADTITDGTVVLKAQGGSLSDGSDMADLAGTATTLQPTADNQLAVLDLYRPQQRYIRAVAVRGGATGAVLGGIIAMQYGTHRYPTVDDPATVAAQKLVISPAFGTP